MLDNRLGSIERQGQKKQENIERALATTKQNQALREQTIQGKVEVKSNKVDLMKERENLRKQEQAEQ